jgi:hypothetical protein
MKLSEKFFNPNIDEDVIAYRIVQGFKQRLETDEWFLNSTEDEKIFALSPYDDSRGRNAAIETLNQMGYCTIYEDSYYGGPFMAIKYYPNPETLIKKKVTDYCRKIYYAYSDDKLLNPSEKDLKIISFIKEKMNGEKYQPFNEKIRKTFFNIDFSSIEI